MTTKSKLLGFSSDKQIKEENMKTTDVWGYDAERPWTERQKGREIKPSDGKYTIQGTADSVNISCGRVPTEGSVWRN